MSHTCSDQQSQKAVFLKRSEVEWDCEQKVLHPKHPARRLPFDQEKLKYPKVLLDKSLEKETFLHSWIVINPGAVAMDRAGLLPLTSAVDGASALSDQTMINECRPDADNHVVFTAVGRFNDTERKATIIPVLKLSNDYLPSGTDKDFVTVGDAQKGILAACSEVRPRSTFHFDINHAGENLSSATSSENRDALKKLAYAYTDESAAAALDELDEAGKKWLKSRLSGSSLTSNLGLTISLKTAAAYARGAGLVLAGNPTSNIVESYNKSLTNTRLASFCNALLIFLREEAKGTTAPRSGQNNT